MDEGSSTEGRCGKDRAAIALVKVGAHTGNIAHIIAHIIGNGCRITRIVFRNTCLHLTHKIGAYIGSFRIDTATHTRKQRLSGSPHTEREHCGSDNTEFMGGCHHIHRNYRIEQQIPERNIEQAKPDHNEPHHRTTAESNTQTGIQ